jgi:hypothetical protein
MERWLHGVRVLLGLGGKRLNQELDPVDRLRELIQTRWLPAFVDDNPGATIGDYHEGASPLSSREAGDFLTALDSGVLEMVLNDNGLETGLMRLPGYRAYYCYAVIGRPSSILPDVQLYRELLTHLATAARLHLEFGYPKHALSMDEDSFDVVVHGRHNEPFIAVEVKKQQSELDKMVNRLLELSRQ